MKRVFRFIFIGFFLLLPFAPVPAHAGPDPAYDVVIVGGGMAGMAAAWYIRDHDILVLEKRGNVGGRAFSLARKGFVYAGGAEYLGRLYGPLKEIVAELDLTAREIPYPMDVYFDSGTFFYGEMGRALLAAEKAGLKEFIRFVKTVQKVYGGYRDIPELDMASKIAALDDISAHDWFKQNRFPPFFFEKYNVTFKGLFGANIRDISALACLSEIAFDYEGVDVDDEFSEPDELENIATPGRYKTGAFSFDKGIAEIPKAIAAELEDAVRVNAEVFRVAKKEQLFYTTYKAGDGKPETVTSEAVILATPAPVTLKIAKEVLSPEQTAIMEQVAYAPFITLALYSEAPVFDKGFDLAVPDGFFFTDVYDATWIPRYYNKALRDEKTYITTVYIAPDTYADTALLSLPDREILDRTFADLEKIFPGVRATVTGHRIFRFTYGYPVMTTGAYRRLTRLNGITKAPLVLAGDYMVYPTLEAAADSGVLAAEKINAWMAED